MLTSSFYVAHAPLLTFLALRLCMESASCLMTPGYTLQIEAAVCLGPVSSNGGCVDLLICFSHSLICSEIKVGVRGEAIKHRTPNVPQIN